MIQLQFAHWTAPPIFPYTRPFLEAIRVLNLPICVVSNIDRADVDAANAFHGLSFDGLVTSDNVRAYKPRPEMFHAALEHLGLCAEEILHVGDSRTSDIAGVAAL